MCKSKKKKLITALVVQNLSAQTFFFFPDFIRPKQGIEPTLLEATAGAAGNSFVVLLTFSSSMFL